MSEPAVAAEHPESPHTPTPVGAETIAGRYLVAEVIHSDARRVVQRGLDEQLQQEVVISVFRSARDAQADAARGAHGEAREDSRVTASADERSSEIRSADADRAGRESFARLAAGLAMVDHPNLARMLDHGVSGVTCFIVHEWLEGETLTHRLATSEDDLTRATVQSIVKQLLAALAALHAHGLAHGNLHPGALFLQRRIVAGDALKLLDVAVPLLTAARLNASSADASHAPRAADETGPVLGTAHMLGGPDVLEYCAPECLAGQAPDARSDVYSVGVMLDELLLQSEPAATQAEQLERDLAAMLEASGDAEEPSSLNSKSKRHVLKDPVLQALVARATATDRAERYADAAELLSALVDAEPRVLCSEPAPLPVALVTNMDLDTEPPPFSESIYDDGGFMSETTTVYDPRNSPVQTAGVSRAALELNLSRDLPLSPEPAIDTLRPPPARPVPARPPLAAGMLVVMVLSAVLVMWLSSESGGASWRALRPRVANVEPPSAAGAQLKAAEDEAASPVAPADEEAREAEPTEQPSAAAADPAAAREPNAAKRPAAYNPWIAPVPPELQGLPALISSNTVVGGDVVHKIRAYNNAQPNDARGHLLVARVYFNRLWRKDCMTELEAALKIDPGVRGAPELLPLLLHLVSDGKAADGATGLIVEYWGRDALPAIDAALQDAKSVTIAERFHALHDRISALPE